MVDELVLEGELILFDIVYSLKFLLRLALYNLNMLTVVIVPGVQTKSPLFGKWIASLYLKYFGLDSEEDNWTENLKEYLENHYQLNVKVLHWSGLREKSLKLAAINLEHLINTIPQESEIVLFTKSLGGNIADIFLQSAERKIRKVIYVAVPHKNLPKRHNQKIPLVNIYSRDDNYIDFAIKVLYFGKGSKETIGADNIIFDKLRHSEFNKNKKIVYQGKEYELFEFYAKLIEEE